MEDEQARLRDAREDDCAGDRLRLGLGRAAGFEPRRPRLALGREAPAELADHVVILGVEHGQAPLCPHRRHRAEDRDVREPVALVGHVELERGHASGKHGGYVREPRRVGVAKVQVECIVDHGFAGGVRKPPLQPLDE